MNVEDTIRETIWDYSVIMPNRSAVLEHLFFVGGNGYHWVDGELVTWPRECKDEDAYWDWDNSSLYENMAHDPEYVAEQKERDRIFKEKYDAEIDLARDEIDIRTQLRRTKPINPRWDFPHSKNDYAVDFPDDIKPDWEVARIEAIEDFLMSGKSFYWNTWEN